MTFRQIIALWPTLAIMAADVGASHWVTLKWSQRENIPVEWWSALLATRTAKRHRITANVLLSAVNARQKHVA